VKIEVNITFNAPDTSAGTLASPKIHFSKNNIKVASADPTAAPPVAAITFFCGLGVG
jgi:hypothetical protein